MLSGVRRVYGGLSSRRLMAEFGHIAFERRYLVARGDNGHPQPAQMRPAETNIRAFIGVVQLTDRRADLSMS